MTEREKAVYMISVVSELLGVHPQTLRLYEREGFVRPSRTEGGVRLYSEGDVEQVRMVLRLTRELGVNLAGVEVILSMREKMEKLQDEMDKSMERMREEFIAELTRRQEMTKNPLVKVKPGRIIKIKNVEK
jgi:MerR family transcriptional regulator/heat shock protein HspR